MNNEIMIYQNEAFSHVRTVLIDGTAWFAATDVTRILGYKNCSKAIADHVDDDDKGITKCATPGGIQSLTVINESGVFSLILQSKMPDARRFKRWVTSEILPSLRKRGCYAIDEDTIVRHYFSFRSDAEIEQIVTALKEIDKMNQTCKLQD